MVSRFAAARRGRTVFEAGVGSTAGSTSTASTMRIGTSSSYSMAPCCFAINFSCRADVCFASSAALRSRFITPAM